MVIAVCSLADGSTWVHGGSSSVEGSVSCCSDVSGSMSCGEVLLPGLAVENIISHVGAGLARLNYRRSSEFAVGARQKWVIEPVKTHSVGADDVLWPMPTVFQDTMGTYPEFSINNQSSTGESICYGGFLLFSRVQSVPRARPGGGPATPSAGSMFMLGSHSCFLDFLELGEVDCSRQRLKRDSQKTVKN